MQHTVTERFLRYVQIDTQSDPLSTSFPSTEKQKDLSRLLVTELQAIGIADAEMDEWGYVYATVPANTDKVVPVLCFCSHIDTAPDASGTNVKPIVHRAWDGSDITLPDDPSQIIRRSQHPKLNDQIGNDLITASGLTLLGADNKAGVAEIMDAVYQWVNNPEWKHGDIRILFTPDEEVGRGTEKVDLQKLGAQFAYTMDGESAGSIENETFSADFARVTIQGVSAHPGYAKGKMEHSIKIAAALVNQLPKHELSPETTSGKQGFVHPVRIDGKLEEAVVEFILRDFTEAGLRDKETLLRDTLATVLKDYPNSTATVEVKEQYRNMKDTVDQYPQIVDNALEAIRRAGMTPHLGSVRGGTDGSRLTAMGLPCPNVFAGEHAIHSRHEWVSVQDMEKAVLTILHIAQVWEERA